MKIYFDRDEAEQILGIAQEKKCALDLYRMWGNKISIFVASDDEECPDTYIGRVNQNSTIEDVRHVLEG